MMTKAYLYLFVALLALSSRSLALADWTRFRGPGGDGVSQESVPTPTNWSNTENLLWKVALPGAGVSSPIVLGNRLWVTTYSGYGLSREEPGDMKNLTRQLVCVSVDKGEVLWQKEFPSTVAEDPYEGMGVPQHGYASHTPTTDGERVFAFFGKGGVYAFDLDGNELWHKEVGTKSDNRAWGSSSSLVVAGDVLVVTAGAEARSVIGLSAKNGDEIWRHQSEGLGMVWGTPAEVESDGNTLLLLGVPGGLEALECKSGEVVWSSQGLDTDSFSTSAVVANDVALAMEGRNGPSVAVRIGGQGDVTDTNLVWRTNEKARYATPLVVDGQVYIVASGILTTLSLTDGKEIFKERLPTKADAANQVEAVGEQRGGPGRGGRRGPRGSDYGSPIAADGKIYYTSGKGETFVIKAGPTFQLLALNQLGSDGEKFSATPAISNGKIFLRSDKAIYCVGGTSP